MGRDYEDAMDHVEQGPVPDQAYEGADPFEELASKQTDREVRRGLIQLQPRSERVLRMLYGIGMSKRMNPRDVASEFSVTTVRVQDIKAKAVRRLKYRVRRDRT